MHLIYPPLTSIIVMVNEHHQCAPSKQDNLCLVAIYLSPVDVSAENPRNTRLAFCFCAGSSARSFQILVDAHRQSSGTESLHLAALQLRHWSQPLAAGPLAVTSPDLTPPHCPAINPHLSTNLQPKFPFPQLARLWPSAHPDLSLPPPSSI